MPRRQGKKSKSKNQYYQHDFPERENSRRVPFKQSKGGKFDRNHKDWIESIKTHLADEDIDMGANLNNVRNIPNKKCMRKNRQGLPTPHIKNDFKTKLLEAPIGWYRITLAHGNKYDKQYMLKLFLDKLKPMPFIPIMWQTNGNSCTFYIDDFKVAEKINNLDKQVQLPDGNRLFIRVTSGCPNIDVNSAMKEKMKLAMPKRYIAETKALDLTKFHADPDLQQNFCALSKPIILIAVIDIIAENIPEIEAINLSDNKIPMLGHLKNLVQKLPNLKILHLRNNKIREIAQFDSLTGLPLVDLVLAGNPLCDRFTNQSTYIR